MLLLLFLQSYDIFCKNDRGAALKVGTIAFLSTVTFGALAVNCTVSNHCNGMDLRNLSMFTAASGAVTLFCGLSLCDTSRSPKIKTR